MVFPIITEIKGFLIGGWKTSKEVDEGTCKRILLTWIRGALLGILS